MLPRLEARESLDAAERAALAHNLGFRSEDLRQQAIDALRRKAMGDTPPAPVKADPADLAMMGIGVRTEGDDLPEIASLNAWLGQEDASNG